MRNNLIGHENCISKPLSQKEGSTHRVEPSGTVSLKKLFDDPLLDVDGKTSPMQLEFMIIQFDYNVLFQLGY